MPKVNVNAFGVVNFKVAAFAFHSISFKFQVSSLRLRLEQHKFAACALRSTNHQFTIDNIQWPVARLAYGAFYCAV